MNIPALFIRRPVTTVLVMLGILIFGMMSYGLLPVSELPSVDFPTIQVTANLPGASPETMASAVATPLEKQFSTIAGLDSMTSTSGQGSTSITLQFTLERDLDGAALDVQTAISKAQRLLPNEMPSPPSYSKVNPADQAVLYLALSSAVLPLSQVDEYAQTLMAQRISMISGVAQVQVNGPQKYAVRVQVNPEALAATGIAVMPNFSRSALLRLDASNNVISSSCFMTSSTRFVNGSAIVHLYFMLGLPRLAVWPSAAPDEPRRPAGKVSAV